MLYSMQFGVIGLVSFADGLLQATAGIARESAMHLLVCSIVGIFPFYFPSWSGITERYTVTEYTMAPEQCTNLPILIIARVR